MRRGGSLFLVPAICVAAMLIPGADTHAQRYPDRPMRLIVGFAPGSAPDNVARIVAPQIAAITGQPVVVDTRQGAAGTIATDLAAKASPDGYTIMLAVLGPTVLAPTLYPKLPYDPVKDFAPVTLLAFFPQIVFTSPSGFKSVKELMALARSKPCEVSYASAGSGSLPHLSAELFATRAKVRFLHVPFKSVALALPDLMAGRVSFAFANLGTGLPQVKAGKLTGLAVTGAARTNLLPELPTLAEAAGLPGFEMNDWFGILLPAGTPARTVSELHAIILKMLAAPEARTPLVALGANPTTNSPEEFGRFIKSEIGRWAEVIKVSGAKAE